MICFAIKEPGGRNEKNPNGSGCETLQFFVWGDWTISGKHNLLDSDFFNRPNSEIGY